SRCRYQIEMSAANDGANAKTASENPSRRDVSARRSLAIRAGMLGPGRRDPAHDRLAVLLRDEREREDRGDHLEREGAEKGELERDRRHRATKGRPDREADEVERHRDGEGTPEPRRVGAPLTQRKEDHVGWPGGEPDDRHDESRDEKNR